MQLPDVSEKWNGKINEVTIGALPEHGGTRGSTVTVGGQTTLPSLTFEGEIPHKPVIAGFVADTVPDWPEFVKTAIGPEIQSPAEWAQKLVEQHGVDLINLQFPGAEPNNGNASPADCARLVEEVLKAVKVPLIIWGCGDDEKDNLILPECSSAARGENCLIGTARETNYKTVVAICQADKHKIISEAPVDINIGKQVNILLQDSGFSLEDVVMYQITAALGYGLDYVYTILERARITGLKGDSLMASPQICNVAAEVYNVKEAIAGENVLPGTGDVNRRGPMWEAVCSGSYIQAGADIVILAHPTAIDSTRTLIDTFNFSTNGDAQ